MTSSITMVSASAILFLTINAFAGENSRLIANLKTGKPQTIVTYGTSLTAEGAWVSQLQDALNKKYAGLAIVINSGQGGMWSKWGIDNIESRVIQKKPDVVFIEFAINDAYFKYTTSVEVARRNLECMIDRIHRSNAGTEIILMTMNPPIGVHIKQRPKLKDYYQMYREVARARNLRLIDHYLNWEQLLNKDKDLFNKYVPDGLHPGPEGCLKMITPTILKALGISAVP